MSDFKAKMHQIRFPLGPSPRSRWGAYPYPLAVFKGAYFQGGGKGKRWEWGRKMEGRGRKGEGK